MALDSPINRAALIAVFPDLASDSHFRILSDYTPVYNCIAWAMGYTDRWVDPFPLPGHWWPSGIERNTRPETLVSAFIAEGFEMAADWRYEMGYDKVVLYKKEMSAEWTHAARIVTDESEHSKFGPAWDAQHTHNVLCRTGRGQNHQSYGIPFAFMKRQRKRPQQGVQPQGTMTVNGSALAKLRAILGKK